MVEVRIDRHNQSIIGASPTVAKVTRMTSNTAHAPAASALAQVRIDRHNMEVLADAPTFAKSTRFTANVAHAPQPSGSAVIHVDRHNQEVLAGLRIEAKTTRFTTNTAHAPQPTGAAQIRVDRSNFEVLARSFIPLTPCTVPALWEMFAHNWADQFELETTYRTTVSRSPLKVSEDRTQLFQRPRRSVKVRWTEQGLGFKDNLIRLIQSFRSMADEDWMVPLYCDMALITEDATATSTEVKGDFTKRRFFIGGRVALMPFATYMNDIADPATGLVNNVHLSHIQAKIGEEHFQLADALPTTMVKNCSVMFPVMCVHPVLRVNIKQHHCRLWDIELEFIEKGGATALPPTADDLPPGFDIYRDIPILRPRHDYSDALDIELLKEGNQFELGRDLETIQRGDHSRVKHKIRFQENRDIGWDYIRFFDTRRGRLRPFFLIDQEDIFDVVDLQTNFIDVRQTGNFTEFQKDMGFYGFVMEDGTCFVREIITVQDVATAWRLTVADVLPVLDFTKVRQSGRAHLTRNLLDSFTERWRHCNLLTFDMRTISLLEEKDVTLDP